MWFVLSLLTALCSSLKDVYGKKATVLVDDCMISWSWGFFALPFLFPFLFIVEIPPIQPLFWIALLCGGSLYTLSSFLYIKAIKQNDLSTTVPLLTFTPVFLLLTSPLLIGEAPPFLGFIGVMLIVMGSYLLHFDLKQENYFAPFTALLKKKGSRYMFAVACIWSITSNVDKIGVQYSSPLVWAIGVNSFLALSLFPLVLYSAHRGHTFLFKPLLPIGFLNALLFLLQMQAITMTLVAYVIAIKRTSTLMSVIWGYLFFKEQEIKKRFLGATVMVIGVVLIALG